MTLKHKIFAIYCGLCTLVCTAGLVLIGIEKHPDAEVSQPLGIQNEFKVEIALPETLPLSEVNTVVYGNDLEGLAREDVEVLIEGRSFLQNSTSDIKASVFNAYSLLPECIKNKVPLESVVMLNFSESPVMNYAISSSTGQMIASDTGINVPYFALQALGTHIAEITGVTDSAKFQNAYQSEHGKEWQVEYNNSKEDAFGFIFASVFLGGYEDKWNELHAPQMHSIVTDVISNFSYHFEKQQCKFSVMYGYQDFILKNEKSGTLDERLNAILSKLPSEIQQLIKEKGVVFEYTDNFESLFDVPDGRRILGLFSGYGLEDDTLTITFLRSNKYFESTVLHEVAHFLDWYSGWKYSDEFVSVMKRDFNNAYWVKGQQFVYDESQKAEYFADAFAACLVGCDELSEYWEEYCPDSFAFVKDVLNDFQEKR